MEFDKLTVEELKQGYIFAEDTSCYICNTCKKTFEVGEIFPWDGRFFAAERAMKIHIEHKHKGSFSSLLENKSKYNTFTDKQKELLALIYSGLKDKEIAKKLEVSPSTVRHQRFTFREKAKQAKMYLAIYEQAMEQKSGAEEIVPVHSGAPILDERYIITAKEKEQILNTTFFSINPLKLKIFPKKEKKKVVILTKIAEQFVRDRHYSEKEINEILEGIYEDYAVLRRYLIDYGFMERTNDGREYWLK